MLLPPCSFVAVSTVAETIGLGKTAFDAGSKADETAGLNYAAADKI